MANPAIIVDNISKRYRLGMVGSGTLREDLLGWWYQIRGKEDPYSKIAEVNNRAQKGQSNYVWALRDVNFAVPEGEVLGVIGKNGAGKSTLLKLLSRVTAPTTGTIKARGRIASLLEVGTGFHPELSGRDNIFLNGAIMGMRHGEIKRKLDEIVDFAGVERYIDTPVKRYSSGMYVRLAFAVAAHLEPEILIVDEVLAVGDAEFQKKAIGKMKDVSHGQGRTVLFVSHNMLSIQKLCNRCLLMENGMIKNVGSSEDIVNEYFLDAEESIETKEHLGEHGKVTCNVIGSDGKPITKFPIMSEITFQATISSTLNLPKIAVKIQVKNRLNQIVFTLNNYHLGVELALKEGSNTFSVKIPEINLSPGEYFIDLEVVNLFDRSIAFKASKLSRFELYPADIYASGYLPNSANIGVILMKQKWSND